jgi:purine-cytosine permease-like protein
MTKELMAFMPTLVIGVRLSSPSSVHHELTFLGTCGVCLSSWTIGSSLIGIGLTPGQAMAAVTVGMFFASITAFLNGTPGAKHHLGYGMLARSSFGLWGSYFCIMLNVFQSFVFYVSLQVHSPFEEPQLTRGRAHKCSLEAKLLSSF